MSKLKQTVEEYQSERALHKRKRELSDLKEIVRTPEGRRYIWKILANSGIGQTGYSNEPNQMYYNAGRRDVGNKLLEDLMMADPTAFATMQMEYYSEIKSEEAIAESLLKNNSDEI